MDQASGISKNGIFTRELLYNLQVNGNLSLKVHTYFFSLQPEQILHSKYYSHISKKIYKLLTQFSIKREF